MKLKNRIIIYNTLHEKLNYILDMEKKYKFVKVLNDERENGDICYYKLPDEADTPAKAEMFVKGLEYTGLKVEREDYKW